jgi:hypothetical protein
MTSNSMNRGAIAMRHIAIGKGHTTYLLPRLQRCVHISARSAPTLGLALGRGYVQPSILSMGRLTGIGSSEPSNGDAPDASTADV